MDNNQPLTPASVQNNNQAIPTQSPFGQPVNPVNTTPAQPAQNPDIISPAAPAQQIPQKIAQPAQPIQPQTPPVQPVQPVKTEQPAPLQSTQQVVERPTMSAFQQQPAQKIPVGTSFEKKTQVNHWMKPILDKRPKAQVYVPLSFGEKPGTILSVGINGYFYYIPKGKMVSIPDLMAEQVQNSINQDLINGSEMDLAQNDDKLRNLTK